MRKRKPALFFIMAFIVGLSMLGGLPGISWGFSQGDATSQKIDRLVTAAVAQGFAGAVLVVDHKTGARISRAEGLANESWGVEHTMNSRFLVGSNTKEFTAALILKLIEEGAKSKTGKLLSLDGFISDYLDYYRKDTGSKVTIRQLLTMESGIPSYTEMGPAFFTTFNRWPYKTREFVELFCSNGLMFPPGSEYNYSNANYNILGAVIEEVSGKGFDELLHEKILTPLEMNNTSMFDPTAIYPAMATGYNVVDGARVQRYFTDMSVPYSAGAMSSTAPDFLKWDESLYTEKILSNASKQDMFAPHSFISSISPAYGCVYYGYGWMAQYVNRQGGADKCPEDGARIPKNMIKLLSYAGSLPDGFNASIIRNPEARQVVIVFNNHFYYISFGLAFEITKILLQSN